MKQEITNPDGRPRLYDDEIYAFVIERRQAGEQYEAIAAAVRERFERAPHFTRSSAIRIAHQAGLNTGIVGRQNGRALRAAKVASRPTGDDLAKLLGPRKISLGGPEWSRPERYQV